MMVMTMMIIMIMVVRVINILSIVICAKCSIFIISFTLHNIPRRWVVFLSYSLDGENKTQKGEIIAQDQTAHKKQCQDLNPNLAPKPIQLNMAVLPSTFLWSVNIPLVRFLTSSC